MRVVTAAVEMPDFIVRHIGNQLQQLRVFAEEIFAHVSAVSGFIGLIFAVNHFFHALQQQAGFIFGQQAIPLPAPHHLDDVPARTAEYTFQFLNNFAVTTYRAVEALQVTVDDENQVIELLASGHRNGAQ